MIFLTVGTILPFDRLVEAVDEWVTEEKGQKVFAQVGNLRPSSYKPEHIPWVSRVSPKEFREKVVAADLVVTHAGIGTIVTALTHATPVLVMPREAKFNEHVNDHQLETARHFAGRPGFAVVTTAEELRQKIGGFMVGDVEFPQATQGASDSLISAIKNVIHG